MNNALNLKEDALHSEGRSQSPKRKTIAIIVLVIIIFGAWYVFSGDNAWHAVFLTNNQVYFGHLHHWPFSPTLTLTDVYYLQITQPTQQLSGEDQSQLKLVRLGSEIHGPTSEMVIPLMQVSFWETLRSDSAIVKTIQQGVQPSTTK